MATLTLKPPPEALEPLQKPVTAPEDVILDLERLRPLLTRWPAVLPEASRPLVLPLKVGLHRDLLALAAPGADPALIRRYLGYYAISAAYRQACTTIGAPRYDLDARPAGVVDKDQLTTRGSYGAGEGKHAMSSGRNPAFRKPQASQAPQEKFIVRTTAKNIKTTLVVAAGDFEGLDVPPGQPRTLIEVKLEDGRKVTAEVASKSLRKVALIVSQAGAANATVVVSGVLTSGGTLDGAGVVAVVKAAQ